MNPALRVSLARSKICIRRSRCSSSSSGGGGGGESAVTCFFYGELGLHPSCTDAELKAAFREQALKWHPDRHASADPMSVDKALATAKFRRLTDSYNYIVAVRAGPCSSTSDAQPATQPSTMAQSWPRAAPASNPVDDGFWRRCDDTTGTNVSSNNTAAAHGGAAREFADLFRDPGAGGNVDGAMSGRGVGGLGGGGPVVDDIFAGVATKWESIFSPRRDRDSENPGNS